MPILALEIGGTRTRAGVQEHDGSIRTTDDFRTADFRSLPQLANHSLDRLGIARDSGRPIDIRVAGAGCFNEGNLLSERVPWLEKAFLELEEDLKNSGFRSFRFFNDIVASTVGIIDTRRRQKADSSRPLGVVGIGTGFAAAIAHQIPNQHLLICGSELGFVPIDAWSFKRIRDVMSTSGLCAAVGSSDSNDLSESIKRAHQKPKGDPLRRSLDSFIERIEWLALWMVIAHGMGRLALIGGVVKLLNENGLITTTTMGNSFKNASVGNIQSIVDQCEIFVETDSSLALRGLFVIDQHASPESCGRTERPLVLHYL